MSQFIVNCLSWLPMPLDVIVGCVVFLFVLFTVLHLIAFILDIIPFL